MTLRIPLFPLPGVVLLPETLLPLHIFEPRYREMVADALAGGRTLGLAMLKPGVSVDAGASPVYPVGGAGDIVDSERLEDGRYNILVRGRFRYRILSEETPAASYRIARVEEIASIPFPAEEEASRASRLATGLFELLGPQIGLPPLPEEELSPERLASEIALRLRYEPRELQAILETNSLPARFTTLFARMTEWQKRIELLEPYRPKELDATRN